MRGVSLSYPGKREASAILSELSVCHLKEIGEIQTNLFANQDIRWLILGDNAKVLRSLRLDPQVKGKVRLVYIDPPYATGQAFTYSDSLPRRATVSRVRNGRIAYLDTLKGPEYLEFLRERLILLYDLLSEEGTMYVHVDMHIAPYVRVLLDEIFGEERFISEVTRVKSNPKNFSRKAPGNVKDVILLYAKGAHYLWNEPHLPFTEEEIRRLFPKVDEQGRRYTTTPLHAPGETLNGATGTPWRGMSPPPGRHWRYPPEELDHLDKLGLIEWSSTGNPRKKLYADEHLRKGKKLQDIWEFKDPPYVLYPTQKNLELLKLIVSLSSQPGDLILDAFCGSGTTLLAAHLLGRQWIGIDNSPEAVRIAQKRLEEEARASFKLYCSDECCPQVDREKPKTS